MSDAHVDLQSLWSALKPDERGLVVAVVQHARSGQVLMVGYMNSDALAATIEQGLVTFWSRSRQSLWKKGETSGNTLALEELRVDCDGDALLVRAMPRGPTCHTGKPSCFHRRPTEATWSAEDDGPPAGHQAFARVEQVVQERKAGMGMTNAEGKSYVRGLLSGGAERIGAKLREEADELARAIAEESDERVSAEAADLLFHLIVGLAQRDRVLDDVAQVLEQRFGTSGIDEKRGRGSKPGAP